jgi:hypothetical protein
MRNEYAFCTGHCDRLCTHHVLRIHDKQDLAVFFEPSDQRSAFSLADQCDGMMRVLVNVNADDDLDTAMLLDVSHA